MNKVKQLPYGVSDFEYVMRGNLYYVDKTMYIPQIEAQPNYLMFIRPRRFGKSLLLSMLKTYYDKAKKDQFEELFGSLWIGKHPTELMGRYQVMHLDFSQIGGSIDQLEQKFDEYLCHTLNAFVRKYADDYPDYFLKEFFECNTYTGKLIQITTVANELRIPMYLIIDEYDNFTNVVLSEKGEEVYHKLTHAEGFYRDVFKKFKGTFERIFFTGVSPVTLDDLTSGFNIGWNISTLFYFDKMLGFSTEEVREMFTYYKNAGRLPANCDIEAMIEEIFIIGSPKSFGLRPCAPQPPLSGEAAVSVGGETGAGLGGGPGHLAVAADEGLGEEAVEAEEEVEQLAALLGGAGVGGAVVVVETSLVADADGAAVVGLAVGSHLEQSAVLGDGARPADVEVVADGAEAPGLVVSEELLYGIVLGGPGGGTVEDDPSHGIRPRHEEPRLVAPEQFALRDDLVAADGQGEGSVDHDFHFCCWIFSGSGLVEELFGGLSGSGRR